MPGELAVGFLAILKNFAHMVWVNPMFPWFVGTFAGTRIANTLALQGINKYDGCLINKKVFIDKVSLDERKKNIDKERIKALSPYVAQLTKNIDETLLKDMYRNLSTANAYRNPLIFLLGIAGSYYPKKNRIRYSCKSSIGHELLHLASSFYSKKNKEEHSGFSQRKGYAMIGDGLNEGYTELLASRIFNKDGKPQSYFKAVRIAKLIEFFFEDPKDMQQYYFRHNLPGFIIHMQQFIPRKKFIKMLLDLDSVAKLAGMSTIPTIKSISIELELYKYFLKTNPSREKKRAFESIIKETKLGEIALNKQKTKLMRNITPFDYQNKDNVYDFPTRTRAA